MTTPAIATVLERSRTVRTRPTCIGAALEALRELHATESGIRWPNPKYAKDPVGFARDIIGQHVWEAQVEILEAIRDHKRVTVRSGHKTGKSNTAAIAAWWFWATFTDARVVFTSSTARQVDAILWRELRKMRLRAGRCVDCKRVDAARTEEQRRRFPAAMPCAHSSLLSTAPMPDLARTGFRSDDMRELVGFTARDAEAVAGISGENILYIPDEASGIDDPIFEAIAGNLAGGGSILMLSNPTRTEGEFFLSHTEKKLRQDAVGKTVGFYKAIQVSSEDTPNVREGRRVIPGLATREWVDEKRREWGEDSALYKVRVKGEFVLNEDGKIVSVHAIHSAEARWSEACDERGVLEVTPTDGRLHIGADPAGPGLAGDEHAWAMRRGFKLIALETARGLTEEQHVARILKLISDYRLLGDTLPPVVTIDREGPIGSRIYGLLAAYLDGRQGAFVLAGIRSSDRAHREPQLYDRQRDVLWANLAAWFRLGGAIPEDTRLARELHAPSWFQPLGGQKLKVTSKEDLRKMLDGQSPDRADAVALAVWEPTIARENSLPAKPALSAEQAPERRPLMDPFAGFGVGGGGEPGPRGRR